MIKIVLFVQLTLLSLLTAECQTPMKYLALGDSYTIGESVNEDERWPVVLSQKLTQKGLACSKPTIIATTGWRTDNLLNAMAIAKLKPEYDLVSLLIGVNNQYQGKSKEQYSIEFEQLLKKSIELAKGDRSRVFVVSIPDYGFTTFGEKDKSRISKEIDEFNSINRRITEQYKVSYIDIIDISRQGLNDLSLVANDGLHPSGKMYSLWVDKILPMVRK